VIGNQKQRGLKNYREKNTKRHFFLAFNYYYLISYLVGNHFKFHNFIFKQRRKAAAKDKDLPLAVSREVQASIIICLFVK
jgi:hypothetical protein